MRRFFFCISSGGLPGSDSLGLAEAGVIWAFARKLQMESENVFPGPLGPGTPVQTELKTSQIGKPQMWERTHVGLEAQGGSVKAPRAKQCHWRKQGLCDTRLAEARPPMLRNVAKYR